MATALQVEPRAGLLDVALALEAAQTAAWRWVVGSPAIAWSPRASRVLRIPEIVLRSPDLLLAAVDPDDLELARCALPGWRDGHPASAQIRLRLGGQVRWLDVAGRWFPGQIGMPAYVTGMARDVTEDREAQDALLQALHEAEDALAHLSEVRRSATRSRVA